MTQKRPLLGGIEAGGTKIVCAVARDPREPLETTRIATGEPEATLAQVAEFFRETGERCGPLAALGIGTFGPAGVTPGSASFGSILTTPKEGWSGFGFLETLRGLLGEAFPAAVAFDTDVNAAAIGETAHGAARGCEHVAYITVGTGIGGGFLHRGKPLHGRMHPEIGHLFVPDLDRGHPEEAARVFEGVCPFHDNCLEGRASGTAIARRWGRAGADLPANHPAWELEADYLALGMINLTAAWSPEIVILGGGVSQQPGLIASVRERFARYAGGYWDLLPLDEYIVPPQLGQQAGIVGALEMAADLL